MCFSVVSDIASRPEWGVRLVAEHAEWEAPGVRGCCDGLSDPRRAAEPHHLRWLHTGWASRLPYLSRGDCGGAVRWLGGGSRPTAVRTVLGFWGWRGRRAAPELGPLAVTATGAAYSPRLRVLYAQHPEYHAPPTCDGPTAHVLLALSAASAGGGGGAAPEVAAAAATAAAAAAAAAALPRVRRAVSVVQSYGASYWHLLLEVAPRVLAALPLLRRDAGCALLAPPAAAAAELARLLGVRGAVLRVPPGGAVVAERLVWPTSSPFAWHSLPPRSWLRGVRAALLTAAAAAAATPLPPAAAAGGGRAPACAERVLFSVRASREAAGLGAARRHLDALLAGGARCTAAVRADALPLGAQLRLFGATAAPRVRVLVGAHGANLVHALWAPLPCAVVEVVPPPPRPAFANYHHLAAALGLDHFVVPAQPTSRDDFAVEPWLLVRAVLSALDGGGGGGGGALALSPEAEPQPEAEAELEAAARQRGAACTAWHA